MANFNDILSASGEDLVRIFYPYGRNEIAEKGSRVETVAKGLKLGTAQLICAAGFNPHISELPEILEILGYPNVEELVKERNRLFISDIYKKLPLDNVLAIYGAVRDQPETLQTMQYLLESRLAAIESEIEATVNSMIIEKYKAEMRAIYSDGIAGIDFAEKRLQKIDSGFRALLNEVSIIAEYRIIPPGNIFFRDAVLPEEKRKLLNKGLIPTDLIEARLQDEGISQEERKMLNDFIRLNRQADRGASES